MKKRTKKSVDHYQVITNKIIEMMETHGANWSKPWVESGMGGAPVSISTGNPYRGINWMLLGMAGYSDRRWGTFKAWQEKGASVRKGEKATSIVFFKQLEITDKDTNEQKNIPLLRAFSVFNAEQVEGAPEMDLPELTPTELLDHADAYVQNTGALITYGGDVACYSPVTDKIKCPTADQFHSTESYYGTLLHELVHWTGHKTRCNRDLLNTFGSEDYAKEELVAELGAAFLCCDLGITPEPRQDHAGYLAGWLKVLKSDKKFIVRAATKAQAAIDHLNGLQANRLIEAA